MANHVSALKRARQTVTRSEVNRANRSRVRTSLRAMREAITAGDAKVAQTQYRETVSTLEMCIRDRLWRADLRDAGAGSEPRRDQGRKQGI